MFLHRKLSLGMYMGHIHTSTFGYTLCNRNTISTSSRYRSFVTIILTRIAILIVIVIVAGIVVVLVTVMTIARVTVRTKAMTIIT